MSLPMEDRGIAMLYAPVLEKEEEELVTGYAQRLLSEDLAFKGRKKKLIHELISLHTDNSVTDFDRNSEGLSCRISNARDQLVFFSVPNEEGWEIMIDEEKAEPIDAGGFILLRVPAGEHSIRFLYHTPGLKAGAALSCIGILAFVILLFVNRGRTVSAG